MDTDDLVMGSDLADELMSLPELEPFRNQLVYRSGQIVMRPEEWHVLKGMVHDDPLSKKHGKLLFVRERNPR